MAEAFILGTYALMASMVIGLMVVLYLNWRKDKELERKKQEALLPQIAPVFVDALKFHWDVRFHMISILVLVDGTWKEVAHLDFSHVNWSDPGSTLQSYTMPIQTIKNMNSPIVLHDQR